MLVAAVLHATDGRLMEAGHPVLSNHPEWAGLIVIIAAGLLVSATAIGWVVRMNAHDEPKHSVDQATI